MTHTIDARPAADPGGLSARLASYRPAALAVLRIGAGLLFMQHGAQKLFGMFGGVGETPGMTVPLFSQMGLAGVLEFFGGLLIVLGLFTQPIAFLVAIEMLIAFFQAHAPRGGVPLENGGEVPLLYMLVWITLGIFGAGALSIDAARARRAAGP